MDVLHNCPFRPFTPRLVVLALYCIASALAFPLCGLAPNGEEPSTHGMAQVPNLLGNRYNSVLRPLPRCVIWSVLLLVIQYKTRFTSRPCHPSFRTSRSCRPVLRGSAQIRSGWTTRRQRPPNLRRNMPDLLFGWLVTQ